MENTYTTCKGEVGYILIVCSNNRSNGRVVQYSLIRLTCISFTNTSCYTYHTYNNHMIHFQQPSRELQDTAVVAPLYDLYGSTSIRLHVTIALDVATEGQM